MKLIPLTKGQFALVDDSDFERLNAYRWHWDHGYAVRNQPAKRNCRKLPKLFMHREILGPSPESEMQCDHINSNKLDNQRANLRYVTQRQNAWNVGARNNNASGFKGVVSVRDKWYAKITVLGRRIHLGVYLDKVAAARAYDAASRIHFGTYGKLNFPEQEGSQA